MTQIPEHTPVQDVHASVGHRQTFQCVFNPVKRPRRHPDEGVAVKADCRGPDAIEGVRRNRLDVVVAQIQHTVFVDVSAEDRNVKELPAGADDVHVPRTSTQGSGTPSLRRPAVDHSQQQTQSRLQHDGRSQATVRFTFTSGSGKATYLAVSVIIVFPNPTCNVSSEPIIPVLRLFVVGVND